MKKIISALGLFIFLMSIVSAYDISETASDGTDNIVVTFLDEEKLDLLSLIPEIGAIIPPYLSPDVLVSFKGEMLRTRHISDLLGAPNELEITIAQFSQNSPNFMGSTIRTFKISLPQYIQDKIRVESNVIFSATMTTPKNSGKYRYRSIAKRNGVPIPAINIDYDSFTITSNAPVVCPSADVETNFYDVSRGEIKEVVQTQYIGTDCHENTIKTYNILCDLGYEESGSKLSAKCVKIPEDDPAPEEKTPEEILEDKVNEACSPNEFCCQYSVFGAKGYSCKTDCYRVNEKKVDDGLCLGDTPSTPTTEEEVQEILDKTDEAVAKGELSLCSLPNGAFCEPPRLAGTDDSGQSSMCRTGWCRDIRGILGIDFSKGGICAPVGQLANGKIDPQREAHSTCIAKAKSESKTPETPAFVENLGKQFNLFPKTLSPTAMGWVIVFVGSLATLFILSKIFGGKGGK